ncbi:MAG: RNA polymerase sigma factor [Steroidobacteraceae bacterium]
MHPESSRLADSHEFTAFMRAYQDMVFTTALRLTGNAAQAEDIAQDVFLRAYERFGQLRTSPTAGGWLKKVATHLTLNHLSRYRRRWRFFSEVFDTGGGHDDELESAAEAIDDLFAQTDLTQRRAIIEQALGRLPQHQRVPLVLYHFEDLSYREIAARLGVSLAKVKVDILRGRIAMAALLARSGLDAPSVAGARS